MSTNSFENLTVSNGVSYNSLYPLPPIAQNFENIETNCYIPHYASLLKPAPADIWRSNSYMDVSPSCPPSCPPSCLFPPLQKYAGISAAAHSHEQYYHEALSALGVFGFGSPFVGPVRPEQQEDQSPPLTSRPRRISHASQMSYDQEKLIDDPIVYSTPALLESKLPMTSCCDHEQEDPTMPPQMELNDSFFVGSAGNFNDYCNISRLPPELPLELEETPGSAANFAAACVLQNLHSDSEHFFSNVGSLSHSTMPQSPIVGSTTLRSGDLDHTLLAYRSKYSGKKSFEPAFEFRESCPKKKSMELAQLAMTQEGSRFLQREIARYTKSQSGGDDEEAKKFIEQVVQAFGPMINTLMTHTYANYLVQHVFARTNKEQRYYLLCCLVDPKVSPAPPVHKIAENEKGTHALQGIIGHVQGDEDMEQMILEGFTNDLVESASHPTAFHVLQKIASTFIAEKVGEMFLVPLVTNIDIIAKNPQGVCVLKKCVRPSLPVAYVNILVDAVARDAVGMAEDPYANFLISEMLEIWPHHMAPFSQRLKGHVAELASQKCASNIIERLVERENPEGGALTHELLTYTNWSFLMRKSQYGIFTANKIIKRMDDTVLNVVLVHTGKILRQESGSMSLHMLKKWETFFNDLGKRSGNK